ncbi:radical SAM protein [Desulfosarcina ovata]|uniref:Radical SAM core domain-containing protein n=1 Tax=Desulfosarcina ovata subsp. ovata TaxID=2752305 RepID=A0A5K8A5W5_9BACT|nr:radical SAM protein [Desulfosarcina ovata]BBO87788.1 hypothetical protein DSCOOX_09680 [Desulfosarcina ovata subsp. ovata]
MKETKQLKQREHDFAAKLKQASVIERLKAYIDHRRKQVEGQEPTELPLFSPVSINLDLTSACNFACPHCVDAAILNSGEALTLDTIDGILNTLIPEGLLSIIILGGGEPTLHKDFEKVVTLIKQKGLQLGIVTNGSCLERVYRVAEILEKHDWVRLSIDAARQDTFESMHRPKSGLTLKDVLEPAARLKGVNPSISLGYSFVIVWDGISVNGHPLTSNLDEMAEAVQLAAAYDFDYVSFKPCLLRLPESEKETLLHGVKKEAENRIRQIIERNLEEAKKAGGDTVKVLESVNLRALLENRIDALKHQPNMCHMQFFRTVLSPAGIFHCPAFRGVEKAKIGTKAGYSSEAAFLETQQRLSESINTFDAASECCDIGCFYHHVNWWLENFIRSVESIDEIETILDDNFFL